MVGPNYGGGSEGCGEEYVPQMGQPDVAILVLRGYPRSSRTRLVIHEARLGIAPVQVADSALSAAHHPVNVELVASCLQHANGAKALFPR